MIADCFYLMEHTQSSLSEVFTIPISFLSDYQQSSSFKYKESVLKRDNEFKEQLILRIDNLIKIVAMKR